MKSVLITPIGDAGLEEGDLFSYLSNELDAHHVHCRIQEVSDAEAAALNHPEPVQGGSSRAAMPAKVLEALKHVNSLFPEVTQVFYGTDGRWLFCGEAFEAPDFEGKADVSLLEDAAHSVEDLPAAFTLET